MPLPLLTETVAVAIVAAISGTIGALINGASERGKSKSAERMDLLEALTERVSTLEREVRELRSSRDAEETARREAERLAWHILDYARTLIVWARKLVELLPPGVEPPPEPVPPDSVKDHL